MKAQALDFGDTIALIAPASTPQTPEKIHGSVRYFQQLGYRIKLGKHIETTHGYLAGTDKQRLEDLHEMIADPSVKAIFFIRGGYGTIRLLPFIDYELIGRNPKIIVGYSDATALFHAIYKKTGLRSLFYGPMPGVDIWDGFDPFAEECMWKALTTNKAFGLLPAEKDEIQVISKDKFKIVESRMFGGNLAVFSSLMGTPYLSSLNDKILFFEDVGENIYRIDRYLAQLRAAGILSRVKAILLGQFTDCNPIADRPSLTLDEVFNDYFSKLNIPVLKNLPLGHIPRQWTVPFGGTYRIEGNRISITQPVLR